MKAYYIVTSFDDMFYGTPFSTSERAELRLLNDDLCEDGYFIQEWEICDEDYAGLLAQEAQEDDDGDRLLLGRES